MLYPSFAYRWWSLLIAELRRDKRGQVVTLQIESCVLETVVTLKQITTTLRKEIKKLNIKKFNREHGQSFSPSREALFVLADSKH